LKKTLFIAALCVGLLSAGPPARAQSPSVQVYFDENFTKTSASCEPGSIDTAFVVAKNFNIQLVGIEYAVHYPDNITYFGEVIAAELWIGVTLGGIMEVFPNTQNAFEPVLLASIIYRCDSCDGGDWFRVIPNPASGFVRATRFPDIEFVYGAGYASVLCSPYPREQLRSWGEIKALYK